MTNLERMKEALDLLNKNQGLPSFQVKELLSTAVEEQTQLYQLLSNLASGVTNPSERAARVLSGLFDDEKVREQVLDAQQRLNAAAVQIELYGATLHSLKELGEARKSLWELSTFPIKGFLGSSGGRSELSESLPKPSL